MSLEMTYPFTKADNYVYDSDRIQVVAGHATLRLQSGDGQFDQDFSNDTGFDYDPSKIEFVSGTMRQTDLHPDLTFMAKYDSGMDADYSVGDGTVQQNVGGVTVSGGMLDLRGGTMKYIDYDADLNADSQQVGCVRIGVVPNYTGAPATIQSFFSITKSTPTARWTKMCFIENGGNR